jgi:hypothetical protein
MSLSMYDISVPVLLRGFGRLSNYLNLAAEFAAANNVNPTVLVTARLAPDMLPLAGQIQRASDNAKGAMARLAGIEVPSFSDNETTFEELHERINKTVAILKSVTREQLDGTEAKPAEMRFKSVNGVMRGDVYLLQVVLPNFFFHVATAHDILRHNGLKIGKKDYFGDIDYI